MDNQELKRLLAANLRGHYRWLVICYQHKLYNFVRYMLHDPEEAKDLVQDIFIKALEALSSFSQPQWEALELQPWLFTIARNHCLNYITRVEPKRSKLVSLDQSQGKESFEHATHERFPSPEREMENKESIEELRKTGDPDDLQDLSTGARRLAKKLREMGNIPAPDSILPIVEANLNLEHAQPFQPAFIEALIQALHDEQWQVRSTAAHMLGTLGDQAPKELVTSASHDQDPRVRAALLCTTSGQVKSSLIYRVAIMALRHDEDSNVRAAAAQTLGNFGDWGAVKALEKALIGDDVQVRTAAAHALKMLRERRQRGEDQARSMKDDLTSSVLHEATLVLEDAQRKCEGRNSREGNENGKGMPYSETAHASHTNSTQILGLARRRIGPYNLLQSLGSGGFAAVYRGRHVFLRTEAAIKVLHASLLQGQVEQFIHEAQTIASLEHPNIIRVLNFDVADDIPFLAMEYAPNGTLRQRHPRGTLLPLETVISYVEQIAEALQYAHDKGVIHRDIKPENMLLGQRDEVILSDFGIAIGSQSPSAQMTQDIMGTIPYMAPEQIQGRPNQASDQYALAVVVYEWLSGTHPFTGHKWEVAGQHLSSSPPSLRTRVPYVPQAVERVVMKALAKDPNRRFESISEFAYALSQASKQVSSSLSGSRGKPGSSIMQNRKKKLRPPIVSLILTVFLFLFGGIGGAILSLSYSTDVIITPVDASVAQNYTLSAVPVPGRSSQLQVYSRLISATPPPQSTTTQASGTGETQGTSAKGTLTFFNGLSIAQTIDAGTRITNVDGEQVVTDEAAIVPPADPPLLGSVVVPAHAVETGNKGNIVPGSIDQTCCSDTQAITVKNLTAFSGGQDPQPYTFVQQSDIDRAADLLAIPLKTRAYALLQEQVRSNEALINPPQCTPTVYSDHAAGDRTTALVVTVTLTCKGEIYDKEGAATAATALLKADAAKQLGDKYALAGAINTRILQATPKGTQPMAIVLLIHAEGTWTFQFTPTRRQELVKLITGKMDKDAHDLLLKQAGIARVKIQSPWWVPWIIRDTLPTNSSRITLVINSPIDRS